MRSTPITTWYFLLGDEPDAWKKNFSDADWRVVAVPHDWSVEQAFSVECSSGTGYLPGGVGWYRAHVSLSGLVLGGAGRVRLVFGGVYKNADVWVNGYHMGSRPSGYAEFSFDLTEILSYAPDDDLVVSVRIEHTDLADSRWFNGSGITKGVKLEVNPDVCLAEYGTTFTTLSVADGVATVGVEQVVENHRPEPVNVVVRQELASPAGVVHEFSRAIDLPAGGSGVVTFTEQIAEPELWSDVRPNLHRLRTVLDFRGGSSVHEQVVGIRTFQFDADKGFSINGTPRKLKGVCLHEDAGCLGVAVPEAVWLRRLLTLKGLGCNAVRMAHNPHSRELYALCDALGLFVIDEAFDEWENPKNKWWQGHNVYPPKHEGYAKDFPVWHERDLVNMVDAHRNHPSIIAWSIGNEVDYPNDPYASPLFEQMTGNNDANKPAAERIYDPQRPDIRRLTSIANRLIDIVRARDTTRPVTLAAAFPELSSLTGLLDRLDLIGYNYKEHLYEEHHRRFPSQPLIGSENNHGYEQWRAVVDNDFIAGQFLWTGVDYLGEAHGWPIHGSGAGLLTLAGFPKPRAELRRSWWTDEPFVHLATRPVGGEEAARRWDADGGEVEVWCFTNCDAPALSSGVERIPLTFDDERGHWVGIATPGEAPLVVEGRRGDVVVRDELVARGPAVGISAGVWQVPSEWAHLVPADAEGRSVWQVEVALVDADGNPAADDAWVDVEVGGGRLLGVENGDLADNTPYSEAGRRTLDGRLIVYAVGAEDLVVRLSSDGLEARTIECTRVPGHARELVQAQ